MKKVKLTITAANCRGGYHSDGDIYIVEDLCPPLCHELWNMIYPSVYVLLNGGTLDHKNEKVTYFDYKCSDEQRVVVVGELIEVE